MEITVFDSKGRITTMAKKAAKTTGMSGGATAAAAPAPAPVKSSAKKTETTRAKKHAIAQVPEATDTALETVTTPLVVAAKTVTHEEISRLAYQFYLERGAHTGSPAEDWFRAEQALIAKL
jgi:hypothetical protein